MSGADIVVAGAGAVGCAAAYVLARAGCRVTVADPAPAGANASRVAAGMLAPAFESLFDAEAGADFALLRTARDLWPALAAEIGLPLAKDGALALGTRAEAAGWVETLAGAGAEARLLAPADVAALAPDPPSGAWAAFTPEDWRLAPETALARLRRAAERCGARFVAGRVVGYEAGQAQVEAAPPLRAERLVLATGAARGPASFAPELAALTPIKGHILRAAGDFAARPVARAAGAYLCLGDGEAILGATMEAGISDPAVDPAVAKRLLADAAPLLRGLGPLAWRAAAGVRASSADGLPLVGEGCAPGVVLAAGARRNGWLLAPLIAQAVLDIVEGRAPGGAGVRFAPTRLDPPRPGLTTPG
ncbi:MAG TPA: FAD-dependent oxidoreductase [Caulobacteraceae bacterium]|jgi:glycine oxidase